MLTNRGYAKNDAFVVQQTTYDICWKAERVIRVQGVEE